MDQQGLNYADPQTKSPVKRSASQWAILLGAWAVGLIVWAIYVVAIGFVLLQLL